MHHFEVRLEPFALYTKTIPKLVNGQSIKIVISTIKKTQIYKRIYSVLTYITRQERTGELIGKPVAAHP